MQSNIVISWLRMLRLFSWYSFALDKEVPILGESVQAYLACIVDFCQGAYSGWIILADDINVIWLSSNLLAEMACSLSMVVLHSHHACTIGVLKCVMWAI